MDLLDAIEELEQPATTRAGARSDEHNLDFVEHQVLFVQQQLGGLWKLKHDNSAGIPYYWVFSRFLRLIEEYPDGLTEAIIVTELTKLLEEKEMNDGEQKTATFRKKRKLRDPEDLREFVEHETLQAKVTSYESHRLTLKMENATDVVAHMYLHQKFRACVDFFHHTLHYESCSVATFPFQPNREIAFTNAKLLERKKSNRKDINGKIDPSMFMLLPTPLMTLRLDEENALDRKLFTDAVSLNQVDELVSKTQDPAVIQSLIIKAKVLDIGAIRACQTSFYFHRQVIMLGEIDQGNPELPVGTTTTIKQRKASFHLMVLWDDQVALSRLFRVGDTLTVFHPFVHVCEPSEAEILHVLNEYSSQYPLTYYFEYGSATVLFCKTWKISTMINSTTKSADFQQPSEMEQPLTNLDTIQPGWRNFSLYAHVRSIKVSHGIPLLAAFFSTYYTPEPNQSGSTNAHLQSPPPLDGKEPIMSTFYLVVLLEVYLAASNHILTIEVTGTNALTALRLFPGQSLFLDGLVAMDVRSKTIECFRERKKGLSSSRPSTSPTDYAFSTEAYCPSSSSSGVVVLCSDWEKLFGNQSFVPTASTLQIVNTIPGLMNLTLTRSISVHDVATHALARFDMTVVSAGWLIPIDSLEGQRFTIDTSCEKGQSTMYAHKSCSRRVEMMTREQQCPKWKCQFCHELFFGLQDIRQLYCDLAVMLENGHAQRTPLLALCQGETVERLLGLSAPAYGQLSLAEKRKQLDRIVGSPCRLVLSRCEPRPLSSISSNPFSSYFQHVKEENVSIHFRLDNVQSIDAFAAAQDLLHTLQQGGQM